MSICRMAIAWGETWQNAPHRLTFRVSLEDKDT